MPTALIWGASGEIGRALAARLIREGWRVLAVARDTNALLDLNIDSYGADFARDADVAAAALWAAQEVETVDLWVYAAGDILNRPLADTSTADWARIMAANATGAHAAVAHSLPLTLPRGHLVFVGAYVDRVTLPRLGAYAAAKAALDAYVQVLAKELRDRRVTLVRAGAIDTPLWGKAGFKVPRGALAPGAVAEAIVRAHGEGHKGYLDL